MPHSTPAVQAAISRIGEVIADIAFTAGNMYANGKLPELENSRQFMSDIITWAHEFEDAFDQDTHADDYLELIDAFAGYRLRGDTKNADRIITMMKRHTTIRHGHSTPAEAIA